MKAKTFYGEGNEVMVEILSVSPTGLCKVRRIDDPVGEFSMVFVRHRDRLRPLDDEARAALQVNP